MNNKKCCVVFTTTGNYENAETIARHLIKTGLAACVQIDKVSSFFNFKGELKKEEELRLMIKTISNNYKEVERNIKLHHDYQLPQIIKLDITDGLPDYINWVYSGTIK